MFSGLSAATVAPIILELLKAHNKRLDLQLKRWEAMTPAQRDTEIQLHQDPWIRLNRHANRLHNMVEKIVLELEQKKADTPKEK